MINLRMCPLTVLIFFLCYACGEKYPNANSLPTLQAVFKDLEIIEKELAGGVYIPLLQLHQVIEESLELATKITNELTQQQAFTVIKDNPCLSNELPCQDVQECIKREEWCDGKTDCSDESDEQFCREKSWYETRNRNNCPDEKYFVCSNARCFPSVAKCDGIDDCKDGGDEWEDCDSPEDRTSDSEETTANPPARGATESREPHSMEGEGVHTRATVSALSVPTASSASEVPTRVTKGDAYPAATPPQEFRKMATTRPAKSRRPLEQRRPRNRWYNWHSGYYEARAPETLRSGHRRRPAPRQISRPIVDSYTNSFLPPPNHVPEYNNHGSAPRGFSGTPSYSYSNPLPPRSAYEPYIVYLRRRFVCSPRHSQVHPQQYAPSNPTREKGPRAALPPFSFRRNYTESVGHNYAEFVQRAEEWILSQRSDLYEWGEDTPRAVTALSLITNSFLADNPDNDLMKKRLATHLGIKLLQLRNRNSGLSNSRLAIYINSLLATCQDPRQFMDYDLTEMLFDRRQRVGSYSATINPMVYITLCLVQSDIEYEDIKALLDLTRMNSRDQNMKDRQILAVTALACIQQQERYREYLRVPLESTVNFLLQHEMQEDGQFGSIYRTALAAQALMSINTSVSWDPEKTLDYLTKHQREDGSFGDMLATYLIVPVLSGRSLLHLRNTQCEPSPVPTLSMEDIINAPGPKKQIFYTLKVDNPEVSSISTSLSVPKAFSFFNAMMVAEYLNPQFKFLHSSNLGYVDVHTISGIPNDPERGYSWHLYLVSSSRESLTTLNLLQDEYRGDIQELIPRDCDELIFWYFRDLV